MMTKQAILYARFSPRPNAQECDGIERQFELCRKHCDLHQLAVAGQYQDAGISGKTIKDRPGLQAAIEHVCKVKGVLVAYSLSRIARSIQDAIRISLELRKQKADLCIIQANLDTSTPGGRVVYHIFAALAEFEREMISERTKVAMLEYQANGKRVSDRPPYGWCVDPDDSKRLVEDGNEQAVIEEIMALHERKFGLRAIGRQLIAMGHNPRTGRKWQHGVIKRIIERTRGLAHNPTSQGH
jgi:DNA invertase Pin-like site-specific DNA recombinase